MTSGDPVRLLAVGGSAGGVDALQRFVAALPADLPAAVVVTLHLGVGSPGLLADILDRRCALPVHTAEDGVRLLPGTVHVAQPDLHLAVLDGEVRLGSGARENHHRPSIDVLFRSVALACGPGAVGVVLTGMLDDGAAGLRALADHGGSALVQDPAEAQFPSMPIAALQAVPGAVARPLDGLVQEAVRLLREPVREAPPPDPHARAVLEAELRSALELDPSLLDGDLLGAPSQFSCPDCGGNLRELRADGEPALLRYRCRTGHAYSPQSLIEQQADTVEKALHTALRSLEERADLSARLGHAAADTHRPVSSSHFLHRAEEARRSAEVLRRLLAEHRAVDRTSADVAVGT
ncbi:MAG: chemotaxis protein CheB [Frankiales bacterium]|nr:chemotaxis protein CheB [Frankiales bacterium]